MIEATIGRVQSDSSLFRQIQMKTSELSSSVCRDEGSITRLPKSAVTLTDLYSDGSIREIHFKDMVMDAENSLNKIARMKSGWDGYTGKVVSDDQIQFLSSLLKILYTNSKVFSAINEISISPSSDGLVSLELLSKEKGLLINLIEKNKIELFSYSNSESSTETYDLNANFLAKKFIWLVH